MAYIGFDTNSVGERTSGSGGLLPVGVMLSGIISRAGLKSTKDGSGSYIEVEIDITEPEQYSRRKYWENFNIVNNSQIAAKIGKEALADLGRAAGIPVINDDSDLVNKEVSFVLRIEESKNPQYPNPKNVCEKYWPIGTTIETHNEWKKGGKKSSSQPSTQQSQQSIPTATKAPWKK